MREGKSRSHDISIERQAFQIVVGDDFATTVLSVTSQDDVIKRKCLYHGVQAVLCDALERNSLYDVIRIDLRGVLKTFCDVMGRGYFLTSWGGAKSL